MKAERYKSGRHLPRVKAAAKVRIGTWQVLSALCDRSEYSSPHVTITKRQIEKITGLERKAVQRALAHLRKIGAIVPQDQLEEGDALKGGRGVAVVYALCVVGEIDPAESDKDSDFPSHDEWQAHQGNVRRSYGDYLAEKKRHDLNKGK